MSEQIELIGDVETIGDEVVLTFPENLGVIGISAADCQVTATGVAIEVGTSVSIKSPPRQDGEPDLAHYTTLIADTETSYACVGAQPWINLPGAFIDCTTGKVLGKCYQSFPCTSMN